MAVGKRLRSRDEHLMLIIPMLGVTNLRGDADGVEDLKFPLVSSTTRCRGDYILLFIELSRTFLDRWIFAPFGFCDGHIWTVGSFRIVTFGLKRRFGLEWRLKLRAGDSEHFCTRLLVCLGFSFKIFLSIMADEVQRKIPVEDNIDWVADDPRTTPSKFEFKENFPEDLFTDIEDPGHANWEVRIPGAKQRICSAFKNGGFPVYQITFEHMGLRLPFSDLEVAVFNYLELCPSQLHPNSLAFIRAFEIVAAYLQLAPTVPLFFHIFGIQRSCPRGNVTDKCGWVSLKQHKKYFEIFEESLRGFKDKWFVVRPITSVGWKTIIVRGPKLDDEGRVEHRDDGEPIEIDCERFPFCWSTKHYAQEAKSFTFRKGALSAEELADLQALEDFVEAFPPSFWEDREGNPICDEQGYQLSSKKILSTQGTVEEVTGDRRPPKTARVEGGGSVVSGPHRLVPGKAAEEFVIPPAMGHDCVVDGRTNMKISDADQSILASMGPESIRNVVAESSVAVFKLLEGFGERLSVVEKDLASQTKAYADAEEKVTKLENELHDAKEEEGKLKEKVRELEEKLSSLTLASTTDEEEKRVDPRGSYAKFSRADLIAKIYEVGDLQLEVASSSFQNALAQLQVLNPEIQLVTDGLDELKEVRDGRIATPPHEEEE
ncbi:hypothetical protein TSUD_133260 [Trifolium subterraneum]|uniref:Transposase (putative) gypsy type domain-containing protein n=1 Tax=Trifolium subterraneum TaxID=3900 RepID=A0A2Z6NXD4_TRISU|nr:hypothetical protein TSUD_133260 [Trifolium subterraneum]